MARRWDGSSDDLPPTPFSTGPGPALPPRWAESAKHLWDTLPPLRRSVERSRPYRATGDSRDFARGPRADGLPAAVKRGLRWLDAEVRGATPGAAALLLGRHFQEHFAEGLDLDRVFLPEETVAYALGRTLAGLVTMPPPTRRSNPMVAVAASMAPARRAVLAAWCQRLGLSLVPVAEPSGRPLAATACVVETPNASGLVENLAAWRAATGPETPLIVASNDPLALFLTDLPVGSFADIVIFDVAALATRGDEAASVAAAEPWLSAISGLSVDAAGTTPALRRSDGSPVDDEPAWEPVFLAALLAAELGTTGFRRRARAVVQRRRWLETILERRGLPPTAVPAPMTGQRFRETRFDIPRGIARRDVALAEGFHLERATTETPATVVARCPLAARREDVTRFAEVMAGG